MGASESKLAFKEDIFRLAGEENIPANSEWWDKVSKSSFPLSALQNLLGITTPPCLRQPHRPAHGDHANNIDGHCARSW